MRPAASTVDGSPERVAELVLALERALAGGAPVHPRARGAAAPVPSVPRGTAVVLTTSGSTGTPKLVAISAAALRASAAATAARIGGPARWLLALPAEYVAGVQVIVRSLLAGTEPLVLDLRSGFRPDAFAERTRRLGDGRRCTSLVPTQLNRLLDHGGAGLDALRSYDAVLIGGAALPSTLRERAIAACARIVTTYGMSETSGGCVYDGVPLDGVTVDIEPDGRILIGGPTLASGYVDRPTETAAAFVDGRFRTGDIGRWDEGRLQVLGRADDVIVTGGEKVAPSVVERVLAEQPGVEAVCVTGLPDEEWGQVVAAAVVCGTVDDGLSERLRAAVRAELGRAAVPRRIAPVDEIPLRGTGKPDREAVTRILSGLPTPIR
ncbi:o-succinylbenzoate--CoA ligase [Actinomycetes bacterium KLBMP 9759]